MLEAKLVLSPQCPSACNLESHKSSSTRDTGRTWCCKFWPDHALPAPWDA